MFAGCGGNQLGTGTGGIGDGGSGVAANNGRGGTGTGGLATGGSTGTGGLQTGGTTGAGGYDGLGGSDGTGASPGTGGTGTGGSPGSSIPDGGACSSPSRGPLSTADQARPFGWTFVGPSADAGVPAITSSADAGAADSGTGPARCQSVPAAYPGTSCVGSAVLRSTASGPAIVFADGARLQWNGDLPAAVTPYVANAGGDAVWVDYEKRINVVCPFCGAYTTNTLQIREGQSGQVRVYEQQGAVLPNLTTTQIIDIFGATAAAVQTCTYPAYGGCSTFLRTEFDHELLTSPPQRIVDATLTKVSAPNGTFAVIWASSQESYLQPVQNCADGPGVASDTGFVATRTTP